MSKFLIKRDPFNKEKKSKEEITLVDYNIFEIDENEKKILIQCEKNIIFHQEKTKEHLIAISETLYEAQRVLAKHGNGTFRTWFESLGLKKDFVYMCLKRNELSLELKSDKIFNIPEKAVKIINRAKEVIDIEEIKVVIERENPSKIAKIITESLSGNPTNLKENPAEIIEKNEDNLEMRLKKITKDIKYYAAVLKELKLKKIEIEKEIEDSYK